MDTTSYSALEQRIEELESLCRPIPVGERLPDSDNNVLAYMQDPSPDDEDGDESFWCDGWHDAGWAAIPYGPLFDSGWKVTHWMPLPPAPADAKQ